MDTSSTSYIDMRLLICLSGIFAAHGGVWTMLRECLTFEWMEGAAERTICSEIPPSLSVPMKIQEARVSRLTSQPHIPFSLSQRAQRANLPTRKS